MALSYWRWSKNRLWASPVTQLVKCLPTMQESGVRFLGWEDPPGEGNGNPLQCSCLENPHGLEPARLLCPWDHKSRT